MSRDYCILLFVFFWGHRFWAVLRSYFWLYAQGSLLAGIGGPYGMRGNDLGRAWGRYVSYMGTLFWLMIITFLSLASDQATQLI